MTEKTQTSALEQAARAALDVLSSTSFDGTGYADYEGDRLAAVMDLRAALDYPAPEEEHDDTANYPVPGGLRRKAGVEYGCGKDDCEDCYEPAVAISEGARVRLRHDVDRYPHFIAREGATGTVTTCEFKGVGVTLYARMDEHIPGCEDWDNEVCWDDTLLADVLRDIEVIAPGPADDPFRPELPKGWEGALTGRYFLTDLKTGERDHEPDCQPREIDPFNLASCNALLREAEDARRWLPEVRDIPPGFRLAYHVFADGVDDWYGELVVAYRRYEALMAEHSNVRLFYEIEPLPLEGQAVEENCIEAVGEFPM